MVATGMAQAHAPTNARLPTGARPFASVPAAAPSSIATFRRTARTLRRHALLAVAVFALLAAAAVAIAYGMPSIYRSSATILIEQQEIPRELVRSTITGFADQRIQEIEQRTMTSANLRGIMDRYDLYADARQDEPLELLIRQMRQDMTLDMISADVVDPQSGRPTEATIAFKLSFDSTSPQTAQRIANELTTLFLGENLKQRNELAENATRFFTEEANKLEVRLAELERKIGAFKSRNIGRLPEDADSNLQLLVSADGALRSAERDASVLAQQLGFLRSQLAANGGASGGVQRRLLELETAQAAFTARYAPAHPTLLAAQRELQALRASLAESAPSEVSSGNSVRDSATAALAQRLEQKRQALGPVHPEVGALERAQVDAKAGGTAHTSSAIDPLTSELRRQIAQTEAQLAAVQGARSQARLQSGQLAVRLSTTPGIEGEYRTLLRDYDQSQRRLQELRGKLMEADVSKALEAEQKGERFTLIEPAELPQTPIKPNRRMLLVVGLLFALLGTAAVVGLRSGFDTRLHDATDVLMLTGVPAIVVLPHMAYAEEVAAHRVRVLRIASIGAVVLVLVAIGTLHALFQISPIMLLQRLFS